MTGVSERDPQRGPRPWGAGGPTGSGGGENRGPKSERPKGELRRVTSGRGTRLGQSGVSKRGGWSRPHGFAAPVLDKVSGPGLVVAVPRLTLE